MSSEVEKRKLNVEIVIPVYNRRETTLKGLKSLSKIDKTDLNITILVVDDNSSDGTSDAISEHFPDVKLIFGDGSLHYAAGTNRGISDALTRKPDYILTANDDAIFHEQFLQRLIRTAERNPKSIIGGLLLLWTEPHRVFQVDFKWKTFSDGWTLPAESTVWDFPDSAFEVEGMAGNCVLFPIESIRECGLLDEKSFPYGWGDIQYVVRMRKAGWRLLIEPRSFIWCEPNTYPKPLHQLPFSEIFKILFVNKKHPANLSRQFTARWHSAPNRIVAAVSFFVYCFRLISKTLR